MTEQVFVLDVGKSRFGWWRTGAEVDDRDQRRLGPLETSLGSALASGPVSLGLECPLFIPMVPGGRSSDGEPQESAVTKRALERRRKVGGEWLDDRGWHYGGGATSFAAGFAQLCWLLDTLQPGSVTTDPGEIGEMAAGELFVWEAFVTGPAKGEPSATADVEDAHVALNAYRGWRARWHRDSASECDHDADPQVCAGEGRDVCISDDSFAPAVNMVEVALDQLRRRSGSDADISLNGHLVIRPMKRMGGQA